MFSALYIAGQIIDTQIGFGMVNVLDPMNDTQVPLTGNFMYILTSSIFPNNKWTSCIAYSIVQELQCYSYKWLCIY